MTGAPPSPSPNSFPDGHPSSQQFHDKSSRSCHARDDHGAPDSMPSCAGAPARRAARPVVQRQRPRAATCFGLVRFAWDAARALGQLGRQARQIGATPAPIAQRNVSTHSIGRERQQTYSRPYSRPAYCEPPQKSKHHSGVISSVAFMLPPDSARTPPPCTKPCVSFQQPAYS